MTLCPFYDTNSHLYFYDLMSRGPVHPGEKHPALKVGIDLWTAAEPTIKSTGPAEYGVAGKT